MGERAGWIAATLLVLLSAVAAAPTRTAAQVAHVNHLFVIVLENEDAADSFGAVPPSPYLGTTMRAEGAYLPNFYAFAHLSLPNYLAMISGQPPNLETQADCRVFSEMDPGLIRDDGIAVGQGCVYPAPVQTIAGQLEARGHSRRGYMQDMAAAGPGVM